MTRDQQKAVATVRLAFAAARRLGLTDDQIIAGIKAIEGRKSKITAIPSRFAHFLTEQR